VRVPEALIPLLDQGVISEVVRPLMSGKEADVFLVVSEGERCVAKIYKEADKRSFKHRSEYTEGRRVRNSRQQRAMNKRSKYGRREVEAAWRAAEVDIIYRLAAAGVRVPEPYAFVEGVLVMELIAGPDGEPAPRLVDAELYEDEAWDLFHRVLREVVRMLCAGVVHGDLSDFNVLLDEHGPVVIDFPQSVDPAHNRNARKLLIRDVDNLTQFLARHSPKLKKKRYGEEIWALYEAGELTPDTPLTGRKPKPKAKADMGSLMAEIEAMQEESRRRREALGLPPRRPARVPKPALTPEPEPAAPKKKRRRRKKKSSASAPRPRRAALAEPESFESALDLDAFLLVED